MANAKSHSSCSISGQPISAGSHICQIYNDDNEQLELMLEFLVSGLGQGEKAACFNDKYPEARLWAMMDEHDGGKCASKRPQALIVAGTTPVYFEDDCFDPERMLAHLREFQQQAMEQGFSAARVIGEMVPEIHATPGGERLMEYESRVSLQMKTHPVAAVCQYDARRFDGATIMQVLKVHPLMIIRGAVVRNPYFIPPEQFLASFVSN